MLQFMGDNKRLLQFHEHKLSELETFKSDTQMFKKNVSASLKNLETQVGQLALNMPNQNKGTFPSDTQKNPKDCMAQPEGILEDVLVKVGKFIFPVDFVIMQMEEDPQVPLLLGRPFLATGAALIDVQKGELTLRVGNEAVHFKINRSLEHSDVEEDSCMVVRNNNLLNDEVNSDCIIQNSINEIEMNFQYLESFDCEVLPSNLFNNETVSSINENSQDEVSSQTQQTHGQENSAEGLTLKELPSHLKYEFLEPEKRKPVIISAALTEAEKQKLLVVLRKYKEAIAWSIEDLKGISPSICMHKILLEDNARTSVEH